MYMLFIIFLGAFLSVMSLSVWFGALSHHEIAQISCGAEQKNVLLRSLVIYAQLRYQSDRALQQEVRLQKVVTVQYTVPVLLEGDRITAAISYRLQRAQVDASIAAFRKGLPWGHVAYQFELVHKV